MLKPICLFVLDANNAVHRSGFPMNAPFGYGLYMEENECIMKVALL